MIKLTKTQNSTSTPSLLPYIYVGPLALQQSPLEIPRYFEGNTNSGNPCAIFGPLWTALSASPVTLRPLQGALHRHHHNFNSRCRSLPFDQTIHGQETASASVCLDVKLIYAHLHQEDDPQGRNASYQSEVPILVD